MVITTSMIMMDSVVCSFSAIYLHNAFKFISAAHKNIKNHRKNIIAQHHFADHLWAAIIGVFGGAVAFSFSILHFIIQNIISSNDITIEYIEYGMDSGVILILISGIMFMMHMTDEETEGHPFYVQEYDSKDRRTR